eukprot:3931940-Rhodomonas_salina.1
MLRFFSPAARKGIAGAAALLVGGGLLPPSDAGKEVYREEDEFPEFASAAKEDEVRPGRKLRVIVLDPPPASANKPSCITLFVAHGATSRAAMLYPLAQRLREKGHSIVTFDGFSSGRSPPGPNDLAAYISEEYRKDFQALFAKYAAGAGRNVLVGHSYGSVLSVDVAGEQKDKVAGAVLISSTRKGEKVSNRAH